MEKFTARKRAGIYLRAAEIIASGSERFCCVAIDAAAKFSIFSSDLPVFYPEFALFKPHLEVGWLSCWWGRVDKESRVIALLFAHHIALNP